MKRILVSLIFIPIISLSIFHNSFAIFFHILVLTITTLGVFEIFKMSGVFDSNRKLFYVIEAHLIISYIFLIILSKSAISNDNGLRSRLMDIVSGHALFNADYVPLSAIIFSLILILFISQMKQKNYTTENLKPIFVSVFAFFYVCLFTWNLTFIRFIEISPFDDIIGEYGKYFLTMFLVTIWTFEGGALYIGSKFGKHKLTGTASPNKSVEGIIGGIVVAAIINILITILIFNSERLTIIYGYITPMAIKNVIIFTIIFGLLAFLGDMGESALKRMFGYKDSGSSIPGMGGVLDVFDSVIFSAPILYFLIKIGVFI